MIVRFSGDPNGYFVESINLPSQGEARRGWVYATPPDDRRKRVLVNLAQAYLIEDVETDPAPRPTPPLPAPEYA